MEFPYPSNRPSFFSVINFPSFVSNNIEPVLEVPRPMHEPWSQGRRRRPHHVELGSNSSKDLSTLTLEHAIRLLVETRYKHEPRLEGCSPLTCMPAFTHFCQTSHVFSNFSQNYPFIFNYARLSTFLNSFNFLPIMSNLSTFSLHVILCPIMPHFSAFPNLCSSFPYFLPLCQTFFPFLLLYAHPFHFCPTYAKPDYNFCPAYAPPSNLCPFYAKPIAFCPPHAPKKCFYQTYAQCINVFRVHPSSFPPFRFCQNYANNFPILS